MKDKMVEVLVEAKVEKMTKNVTIKVAMGLLDPQKAEQPGVDPAVKTNDPPKLIKHAKLDFLNVGGGKTLEV